MTASTRTTPISCTTYRYARSLWAHRGGLPVAVVLVLMALVALLLGGCELLGSSSHEPTGRLRGAIHFVAQDGWGSYYELSVTRAGLATYRSSVPELELQLTQEEHRELFGLFDGFSSLKRRYFEDYHVDGTVYTIAFGASSPSDTVQVDRHTLQGGTGSDFVMLQGIVETLWQLTQRVYDERAPWLGLEMDFSVAPETVRRGEDVVLTYRIVNPTDRERTLLFPFAERLDFWVRRQDGTEVYRHVPAPTKQEIAPLTLQPGQREIRTLIWDQMVTDSDGTRAPLEPGRYSLRLQLLSTSHRMYVGPRGTRAIYPSGTASIDVVE